MHSEVPESFECKYGPIASISAFKKLFASSTCGYRQENFSWYSGLLADVIATSLDVLDKAIFSAYFVENATAAYTLLNLFLDILAKVGIPDYTNCSANEQIAELSLP